MLHAYSWRVNPGDGRAKYAPGEQFMPDAGQFSAHLVLFRPSGSLYISAPFLLKTWIFLHNLLECSTIRLIYDYIIGGVYANK